MSRDVTIEMLSFKEASRHLWNAFLMPRDGSASIPLIQTFEVIERELLREMVLRNLGVDEGATSYRKGPIEGLYVRAKEYLTEVPVKFGDIVADGNVRWTEPAVLSVEELNKVEFFDFFGWNPYGPRDFSCVRALDVGSSRLCLFEAGNVDFKFGN